MARRRILPLALLLATLTACGGGADRASPPTTTRPAPELEELGPVERELHDLLDEVGLDEQIGAAPVRCVAHAAVTDLGPSTAAAVTQAYIGRFPSTAQGAGAMGTLLAACAGSDALTEVMAANMEAKRMSELTPVQLRCTFSQLIDRLGPSAAMSFGLRLPVPQADAAAYAEAHRTCGALREMAARAIARTETADVAACAAELIDEDAMEAYFASVLSGDEAGRRTQPGWVTRSVDRCKANLSK